jgi:magnesium chelatase family protein
MLVAATNPCPCGHAPGPRCQCSDADLARHRRRLSGPLLDRLDLVLNVQRPAAGDLAGAAATTSAAERERVMLARERQGERLRGTGAACNAHMDAALLRTHVHIDAEAQATLLDAYRRGSLSARGRDRALRVARTVADLADAAEVAREHVVVALGYRHDQDLGEGAAA